MTWSLALVGGDARLGMAEAAAIYPAGPNAFLTETFPELFAGHRALMTADETRTGNSSLTQGRTATDFDRVVAEHGPYLWRVLRRLGVRASDIEDVWQETFIVVHRKLDGFEGRSSLRTWVSSIAVRVASDYRNRAHRRREQATDEVPEPELFGADQQDELIDRERRALLDRLIAELKPEQRDVLVLYEFAELPMQEVAEAVGCPLQTAYSRLHAARKSLEAAAKRESAKRGAP